MKSGCNSLWPCTRGRFRRQGGDGSGDESEYNICDMEHITSWRVVLAGLRVWSDRAVSDISFLSLKFSQARALRRVTFSEERLSSGSKTGHRFFSRDEGHINQRLSSRGSQALNEKARRHVPELAPLVEPESGARVLRPFCFLLCVRKTKTPLPQVACQGAMYHKKSYSQGLRLSNL